MLIQHWFLPHVESQLMAVIIAAPSQVPVVVSGTYSGVQQWSHRCAEYGPRAQCSRLLSRFTSLLPGSHLSFPSTVWWSNLHDCDIKRSVETGKVTKWILCCWNQHVTFITDSMGLGIMQFKQAENTHFFEKKKHEVLHGNELWGRGSTVLCKPSLQVPEVQRRFPGTATQSSGGQAGPRAAADVTCCMAQPQHVELEHVTRKAPGSVLGTALGWLLMHGRFVVRTLYCSGFLIKTLCGTNSHAVQTSITTTRLPLSTELIISLKEDVNLLWQDLLLVHPAWLALFILPFLHLLIESLISCPIIFPDTGGSLAAQCSLHRATCPLSVPTEHQGSWMHRSQIFKNIFIYLEVLTSKDRIRYMFLTCNLS